MSDDLLQAKPKLTPPLDPDFRPAYLGNQAFVAAARESGRAVPLWFALQRPNGSVSVYRTVALPSGHPAAAHNLAYAERILKFLLWQKGSAKIALLGPREIAEHLQRTYAKGGARAFDADFMSNVYEHGFEVTAVIDGKEVFSCEVVWELKINGDPQYHFDGVDDSIRRAAEHLPRIDAIG